MKIIKYISNRLTCNVMSDVWNNGSNKKLIKRIFNERKKERLFSNKTHFFIIIA